MAFVVPLTLAVFRIAEGHRRRMDQRDLSHAQLQYYKAVKQLRVGEAFRRRGNICTVVYRIQPRYLIATAGGGGFYVLPVDGHFEFVIDESGWSTDLCWSEAVLPQPTSRAAGESCGSAALRALSRVAELRPTSRHAAWETRLLSALQRECESEMETMNRAARTIQSAWRTSISNPAYTVCVSRLIREFEDVSGAPGH